MCLPHVRRVTGSNGSGLPSRTQLRVVSLRVLADAIRAYVTQRHTTSARLFVSKALGGAREGTVVNGMRKCLRKGGASASRAMAAAVNSSNTRNHDEVKLAGRQALSKREHASLPHP